VFLWRKKYGYLGKLLGFVVFFLVLCYGVFLTTLQSLTCNFSHSNISNIIFVKTTDAEPNNTYNFL